MSEMIDNNFPQKTITVTDSDQPWITIDLKKLKRIRQREYCRHGKTSKYFELKKKFEDKKVDAVKNYTDKIISEVTEGTRSTSYKALRKLGVRNGDTKNDLFTLHEHTEHNLSEEQSAEKIADYFSNLSQEYEPLAFENLPPNIKNSIHEAKNDPCIPRLEPFQVYHKILKAKKPNSMVQGDVPKRILQLFSPELAEPISTIYNKINTTFEYPRQWVKESQIPIPKVFPPNREDISAPSLRLFSLASCMNPLLLNGSFHSFTPIWILVNMA